MKDGHLFKKGVQWVFGGNLGAKAFEFIFGVILARLLMPEDFGHVITVQIFTGIASLLLSGGLSSALIQAKEVSSRDFHVVFTFQLVLGIAIFFGFYFLSNLIAASFEDGILSDLIKVSAIGFLLKPFLGMPNALLQRVLNFKAITQGRILSMFVGGILSVLMALSGYGVWSLVFGGLIGSMTNIIYLMWRSKWTPLLVFDLRVLTKYSSFGVKVSLNDIAAYLREQSVNFIISKWIGVAAVGLYNKGFSLSAMPMQIIGGSVNQPLFRQVARSIDDIGELKYYYGRSLFIVTFYTLPIYVGMWWLAESFIINVFGAHWAGSAPVLKILVLTGLFRCMINPSGAVAEGTKNVGRQLLIAIEVLLLLVILTWFLFPYGLDMVAYGVVIVFAYHAFRLSGLTSRVLGVRRYDLIKEMAPALLTCLIMFIVMYIMDYLMIILDVDSVSMTYFFVLFSAGGMAYAISAFLLPISVLRVEANRWRVMIESKVL